MRILFLKHSWTNRIFALYEGLCFILEMKISVTVKNWWCSELTEGQINAFFWLRILELFRVELRIINFGANMEPNFYFSKSGEGTSIWFFFPSPHPLNIVGRQSARKSQHNWIKPKNIINLKINTIRKTIVWYCNYFIFLLYCVWFSNWRKSFMKLCHCL